MHKRNPDNKRLDKIGRLLLANRNTSSETVENIVSNPDLFALVGKRIETEAKAQAASAPPARLGFLFTVSRAQALAGAFILIAMAAGMTSLITSEKKLSVALEDPASQETAPVGPRLPDTTPGGPNDGLFESRPLEKQLAKVSLRKRPQIKRAGPERRAAHEPEGEFVALALAGDADETGGRIVRVDLPRSSLFAMGVNVPLENDAEVVKADLLIASDGTTRGVRVVR